MAGGRQEVLALTALMARDLREVMASRMAKGLREERNGHGRQTARGQSIQSKDMDVLAAPPPPASAREHGC